jgi:dephospho-CoA kinase
MKKQKIIIGFVGGKDVGKTTAANILSSKGFFRANIMSKVEELAKHLASPQELNKHKDEILDQIRRKGCAVCKEYWVNLILIAVPDTFDFIVFDDIILEEAVSGKIKLYQVYRPYKSLQIIPDIETIENNGTLKDFTDKIEDLYKKLSKSAK